MAKFVVAYLNLNVGDIEMHEVSAVDKLDAMIQVLEIDPEVFNTEAKVHEYCADTDSYISYLQL